MMEHGSALVALLYLPIAIMILLIGLDFGDRQGYPAASRFMAGFRAAGGGTKLAALLMAMTAAVHLALIPAHSGEPVTAALFGLDGIALTAVALAAVAGLRHWRPAAAALLVGSSVAYVAYLVAGLETADVIGVATKLVEMGALLVIVIRPVDRFVSVMSRYGSQ